MTIGCARDIAESGESKRGGEVAHAVMLCTPTPLPRATVCMRETPLFTAHAAVGDVYRPLESAKESVGAFKVKYGDAAWKERAVRVDRNLILAHTCANPVSRAYYKLIEIIRTCAIRVQTRSLHICEAPGGFAQAVGDETDAKEVIVMSRKCGGAPHFAPSILRANNVSVLSDLPHASDLTYKQVRDEVVRLARGSELVTADGAIDNDAQPEAAEAMTATLILHEIETAMRAQTQGGTFVLKVFGLALQLTRECIAILTTCYETVSIVKPFTSRAVNDERYIVCQNFRAPAALPYIADNVGLYIESIATVDDEWMRNLQDVVHGMRVAQCEAIHAALTCTLRDTSAPTRPHRPARRGQRGGRGSPYPRGRGRMPSRASTPGSTTR